MKNIIILLIIGFTQTSCAGLPMALSGIGGAMTIAKDGFDLDVSFHKWLDYKESQKKAVTNVSDSKIVSEK
jgi:hypothetical protein